MNRVVQFKNMSFVFVREFFGHSYLSPGHQISYIRLSVSRLKRTVFEVRLPKVIAVVNQFSYAC